MSQLTTIRTFDNYIHAHIVKGRLEEEGIQVFIKDEQTVTLYWIYSNAIGGIKLQVLQEDEAKALALLAAMDEEYEQDTDQAAYQNEDRSQLDPNNKICIYCGSKNTKAEQYDKKWAYSIMLFLGFPLAVKSEKWHCFNCAKNF